MPKSSDLTVVYAREEPPNAWTKSIFLAGPTPRSGDVASWRPQALELLAANGYDGVVFVPEDRPDADGVVRFKGDYTDQVEWEERCLHLADIIVFWLPRSADLPGYTTNDEWGVWKDSGKVVFGSPEGAEKVKYQWHYAEKLHVPWAMTLDAVIANALKGLEKSSFRSGGEREVPLAIWNTESFQQWYGALREAGNQLDHAEVLWSFRVGSPYAQRVFAWVLHVDVWIASEGRHKVNEFVISRPDISTIVLYYRAPDVNDSLVVLVREFRSPVSNHSGFVWELPGGSSAAPGQDSWEIAAHECEEETGMKLAPERFTLVESRQLMATFSGHQADLFSAELSGEEVAWLQAQAGIAHGVEEDSERTFVEVVSLREIRRDNLVDWSMLGMILQVLT